MTNELSPTTQIRNLKNLPKNFSRSDVFSKLIIIQKTEESENFSPFFKESPLLNSPFKLKSQTKFDIRSHSLDENKINANLPKQDVLEIIKSQKKLIKSVN